MLTEKTCKDFAEALASREPVPGGGGGSALVGALGIALCSMVGNFTLGKKKYADVEPQVKEIMSESEELRLRFLELVEADAEAFEPLSQAYSIPKDDPMRDTVMEECLKNAVAAPLKMLRLSCRAIELHQRMGEIGSVIILSDVATGVAICKSALEGAFVNIKVNTSSMTNREFAEKLNAEADESLAKYTKLADKVFADVMRRFD